MNPRVREAAARLERAHLNGNKPVPKDAANFGGGADDRNGFVHGRRAKKCEDELIESLKTKNVIERELEVLGVYKSARINGIKVTAMHGEKWEADSFSWRKQPDGDKTSRTKNRNSVVTVNVDGVHKVAFVRGFLTHPLEKPAEEGGAAAPPLDDEQDRQRAEQAGAAEPEAEVTVLVDLFDIANLDGHDHVYQRLQAISGRGETVVVEVSDLQYNCAEACVGPKANARHFLQVRSFDNYMAFGEPVE